MKRAFHIVLFLLPLSVVMASFALPAHPGTLSPANIKASFSTSNRTSWTPSGALISALDNTAEEKQSHFYDKAAFAFPVTDAAASLSPSVPATQSGDDIIYRRGPTTVESTLPPSPGPASGKYHWRHNDDILFHPTTIRYRYKQCRDKYTLCFWSKQWQCLYLHVRRCTSYYSNEVFCNAKR